MDNTNTPEAQAEQAGHAVATPNFDENIDMKEMKFSFRKDELGNTRPAVEVKLAVPSVEGIAKIFNEGGKGLEVLVSLVQDAVADHVRNLLSNDPAITSANFPFDQATWESLVAMPEAERRGRGIAKEVWESFAKDYIAQMPAVTGKSTDAVTLAAKLFSQKYQSIKSNKDVIAKLKTQLAIYLTTPNAEQFIECVKFLDEKADTLLQADETALLNNL